MITEQDLVYALGIFTGIALWWSMKGVLFLVSYFSKPRHPLTEKSEETAEVPWWEKTE